MKIRVLGSAAGGGFPQWNCNCPNCDGLRKGRIRAQARTQSSIAVSGDDENWVLFNASPDVLQQIRSFPGAAAGARAARHRASRAIVLIDAQIDHTTGLYMLREHRKPWPVSCTACVREDLSVGNPVFGVLGHYSGIDWRELPLQARFAIDGAPGLGFEAAGADQQCAAVLAAPRPPAAGRQHRRHPGRCRQRQAPVLRSRPGRDGARMCGGDAGRRLRAGRWHPVDRRRDDPPRRLGKTSRAMGHLPQSGPGGMLEWLDKLPATTRKVLIHINNTNPILDEDSRERAELAAHGIEVAYDGMEIAL